MLDPGEASRRAVSRACFARSRKQPRRHHCADATARTRNRFCSAKRALVCFLRLRVGCSCRRPRLHSSFGFQPLFLTESKRVLSAAAASGQAAPPKEETSKRVSSCLYRHSRFCLVPLCHHPANRQVLGAHRTQRVQQASQFVSQGDLCLESSRVSVCAPKTVARVTVCEADCRRGRSGFKAESCREANRTRQSACAPEAVTG